MKYFSRLYIICYNNIHLFITLPVHLTKYKISLNELEIENK